MGRALTGDGSACGWPREREVFAHLISGQLNKQIGFDLGIDSTGAVT